MKEKHPVTFAPKDEYYEHFISHTNKDYEESKIDYCGYPTREEFDINIRKILKKKFPDQVIEGEERICGKTVGVWYFYG